MEAIVSRWAGPTRADSTLGALFLDGQLAVMTCEDRERPVKVHGKTAIPRGRYRLDLRRGSPMAKRYDARYAHIGHDGMVWLRDVPGFEYVYFHVGNDPGDTEGCILVGEQASIDGNVYYSREAYKAIYPRLHAAIVGEGAWVTVCGAVMGG